MRVRGALLALGVVLAACSPAPSPSTQPSTSPSPPTASATPVPPSLSPSPTPIHGDVRLAVAGRVKSWCNQNYGGCTYWVTLFAPGGDTYRAPFALGADRETLTLGAGLPATLPPGRFALVFETGVVSDVVSFAPDGTEALDIWLAVACTARLDIGSAFKTTVTVAFDGIGCKVVIREGST